MTRLTATAMSSDGRAVARLESGKVAFVDGALPGETVLAAVVAEKASFASAVAVEVDDPAPERVAPPCPRRSEGCGGCQWQHVSAPGQTRLKEALIAEALVRIGRVAEPPLAPTVALAPWRGRTTIRAGVADGRVALRRGESHQLVAVEGCLIAHPLLLPYLAGRRYPGARSVTLRCGARTGEVLVDVSPGPGDYDLPDEVRRDHFHEVADGRTWRVSARSFFQTRPDGADALAAVVAAAAGPGDGRRAIDAYSGVGLLAGSLARSGWSVTALEGSRRAADDAAHNLAGEDVAVHCADATNPASWPAGADLVVADPSRAGLGRQGADAVAGSNAGRVVLVSCDVASLGRDAGLLTGHGYRLESVTPIDMFPQSRHIEAVSVFRPG